LYAHECGQIYFFWNPFSHLPFSTFIDYRPFLIVLVTADGVQLAIPFD
jgi:hypothetical protein